MKFALLDQLRCSCGSSELRLEGAVTRPSPIVDPTGAKCRKFCGLMQCDIRVVAERPAECLACHGKNVVQGTIQCKCGQKWEIVDGIPSFSIKHLAEAPSHRIRVTETNPRTDPRWEPFIASHPNGSLYHHPGWLKALEEEYGQRRVHLACEDLDGRLLAVLPMCYTRGLPINIGGHQTRPRLSSLPRTPIGGPLSIDDEATSAILTAALECSRTAPGLQVQIKTQDPGLEAFGAGLVRTCWRDTYQLTLPEDPDQVSFGNSTHRHRVKWAVNKASKLGVQVREADRESDLRAWYSLYLEVMRRNAVPPRAYRFIRTIWDLLHPSGLMSLLVAEQHEAGRRRLLAGSIFLTFARTTFYAFTGAWTEDLGLHPNDIILWHAIRDACRKGVRSFDFGEVAEEHQQLATFKRKWGAQPAPLYRYYHPMPASRNSSPGWIRQLSVMGWRRLPLNATAKIGDLLYSYL